MSSPFAAAEESMRCELRTAIAVRMDLVSGRDTAERV
jgi:hypothetical protein